jgi:hypothetical protein
VGKLFDGLVPWNFLSELNPTKTTRRKRVTVWVLAHARAPAASKQTGPSFPVTRLPKTLKMVGWFDGYDV